MLDWFAQLCARRELPMEAAAALEDVGFALLPGPVPLEHMKRLADVYDAASARADYVRVGSSTTVTDCVACEPLVDDIVVFPPLLDACCRVIERPFKLSSFIGRTVRAGSASQELHVDVRRDSADWPLLGFIVMIDDFRPDNGATRFVPGSHRWVDTPREAMRDVRADHREQALACGRAGSLLVFNGSVWHGHTANTSNGPRRSLQGAWIPRTGHAATDFATHLSSEAHSRLTPLTRHVLGL